MTEINGNISKFGLNAGKVEPIKGKETLKQQNIENGSDKQHSYIHDTGVLGRSQVIKSGKRDIEKSVDEAVFLAQNHPELLKSGDIIFENTYNTFLKQGMKESDAYINALLAQNEFTDMYAKKYQ